MYLRYEIRESQTNLVLKRYRRKSDVKKWIINNPDKSIGIVDITDINKPINYSAEEFLKGELK